MRRVRYGATMREQSLLMTFRAKNGRLIHIRPLQQDDAAFLVSIFEHMGSDSRYHRFHQSVDNLNLQRVQHEAEQMVELVPDNSFGLIAFEGELPVGAARYVLLEEKQAEMAVSIRDDYQNSGIGTKLITLLAEAARKHGLYLLVANVQAENIPALRIMDKLPFPQSQHVDGSVIEIEFQLQDAAE